MDINFSKIFHQISKNKDLLQGMFLNPPEESKDTPEEWSTIYYKTYPHLPKIDLNKESLPPTANFFTLIKSRRSRRNFSSQSVTKKELSLLLRYSCGITDATEKRRAQPSGGARYPIEVYPIIFRSGNPSTDPDGTVGADGLKSGLYHYNVKDHQLDVLWQREFDEDDIRRLSATDETFQYLKDAAAIIVMTSVFWRNQNKYGERGYRIILQESGHIGQNIYLVAEAIGLKCFALSGTWDENLEKLIDIDGITESVVYGLAIGK